MDVRINDLPGYMSCFVPSLLYSDIMNNKVFYQHPNLMRALGMHETVMEVMVNVLGEGESKVQQEMYTCTLRIILIDGRIACCVVFFTNHLKILTSKTFSEFAPL